MKRKNYLLIGLAVLAMFLATGMDVFSQEETEGSAIKIKVQPDIIAMPESEVSEVPVRYARIRSTELREINEVYNAVSIEKVYEMVKVGNKPEEKVEVKDTYIIHFQDEFVEMTALLNDYSSVPVVVSVLQE